MLCEDGSAGVPPHPGSLQGRTRCYQNTIHYGSDSSSWGPGSARPTGNFRPCPWKERDAEKKNAVENERKERWFITARLLVNAEGREAKTRRRDETESLTLGCAAKLMKITVGLLGLCRNIFLKMKICFMQCRRSYFKTSLPSNQLLVI